MFVDHFYHERIRKSVAVFGSLFNELYVVRRSGNKVLGQMRVPIAYAPSRKFLERIADMNMAGDRDIENQTAIRLPRMSFEITNMQYDPARQLPKTNTIKCQGDDKEDGKAHKIYAPTPYIVNFELNIYGKQHDDCLQVVEQILPFFNPQYTVSMKPLVGLSDIVEDVPVILQSTSFTDNYEGALEDRRIIIYTLSFDMKINFWGPVCSRKSAVIENIEVDFFNDWPTAFSPPQDPDYLETLRVEARQGLYPYHPVNQDSDYTVNVDVINMKYPYSGDPSYLSDELPTVTVKNGETKKFHIGELFNHHRHPYTEYTLLDSNLSIFPDIGDINIDNKGNLTAVVSQSPGLNVVNYSLLNTRDYVVNTTINIVALPDSTQDDLIRLEGEADEYRFIITQQSDGQNILDLVELEDSA